MVRPQVQYLVFITIAIFLNSCGYKNVSEKRAPVVGGIILGEKVTESRYSFVATLLKNNSIQCSATLISKDLALTSAHCLLDMEADYKLKTDKEELSIDWIEIHPDFDFEDDSFTNFDVALLKVSEHGSDYIKVASSVSKSKLYTLGLGANERGSTGLLHMKEVKLKKNNKYCDHDFGETTLITTKALYISDSGGPLIQDGKLVGLNSAFELNTGILKKSCDRSFYTDMTKMKGWLSSYL